MEVCVVPHDSNWREAFDSEAANIRKALNSIQLEIHHIGSTAIPGIYAKPVIDLLLVVANLDSLDGRNDRMISFGYEPMGECGIPGRRYFRKNGINGMRIHNVHAFEEGTLGVRRHLAFRDYLICHPKIAEEYSLLKKQLEKYCHNSIVEYMAGKNHFIKNHEQLALVWQSEILNLNKIDK
jgi:GrpB-like predicted nucleotidyltransferase (UPF0157 family)